MLHIFRLQPFFLTVLNEFRLCLVSRANRWLRLCAAFTLSVYLLLSCTTLVSASKVGSNPRFTPAQSRSSEGKAVIEGRISPAVYLPGPAFSVKVVSLKPITPQVPELLQQKVQETLLANDPRLRVSETAPDTLIECAITDLRVSPGLENRTRSEYQKIGETMVTDPATGISRTEDVYGHVDVPYRALVFEGRMSLNCEVKDVSTGILIYSDRFDAIYTDAREAGGGSSSVSVDDLKAIYLRLADNAIGLILAQLCPRPYSEVVLLPSGDLKETSRLLGAGSWNEALTALSAMPPFKDQTKDAYRLYSIGVAHEALAFQTRTPAETKRRLEQAVDNYRRATDLKPRENMFWAPKNRGELLLWQAGRLVAQVEAFEEAKRTAKTVTGAEQGGVAKTDLYHQVKSKLQPAPTVITNKTVIDWVKSGRSADYITASIKHATETRFDLGPAEVLKLRRDGVSSKVLKAMADSQRGPSYGLAMRTKVIVALASFLWWVPLLLAR